MTAWLSNKSRSSSSSFHKIYIFIYTFCARWFVMENGGGSNFISRFEFSTSVINTVCDLASKQFELMSCRVFLHVCLGHWNLSWKLFKLQHYQFDTPALKNACPYYPTIKSIAIRFFSCRLCSKFCPNFTQKKQVLSLKS